MKASRIDWLDNVKAIGIVLVVLGHAPGLPESVRNQIYAFHMPLFFWISGYLVSDRKLALPVPAYLKETATSLLVPYLVFAAGSFLYWVVSHRYGSLAHTTAAQALEGIVIGHGPALFINTPLWFFTALFVVAAAFRMLCSVLRPVHVLIGAVPLAWLGVTYTSGSHRLPWNIDLAGIGLLFYALGKVMAQRGAGRGNTNPSLATLLIPVLPWVASAQFNGEVNMNRGLFGEFHVLFFVNATAGIALLMMLSRRLPVTRVGRWLSHNSLVIFPSHLVFFGVFTAVGVLVFKLSSGFKDHLAYTVPFTVLAILAAVPVAALLQRVLPQVFKPTSVTAAAAAMVARSHVAAHPLDDDVSAPRSLS